MQNFTKLLLALVVLCGISYCNDETDNDSPESITYMRSDWKHIVKTLIDEMPDKNEGFLDDVTNDMNEIIAPAVEIVDEIEDEAENMFESIEAFIRKYLAMFIAGSIAIIVVLIALCCLVQKLRHDCKLEKYAKKRLRIEA